MKKNKIEIYKTVKVILFILVSGIHLYSCKNKSCEDLPSRFESHEQAKTAVLSANFGTEENIGTFKSSWIKKAGYRSCNQDYGYFILWTKSGKTYIHYKVPEQVWEDFKVADSYGSYYNKYIKGRSY